MKAFQRLLVAAPAAALLPVAMAPVSGLANDLNLDLDTVQEYSVAQGASIRDFSDVYPTDWAYQALAELVDTYGCVGGYPDNTFRGDQPITRFEMAAILNSCMEAMSAKMGMMDDDIAMEDKETLEKLASSFEEELITLKGTVDGLDARVSELEENSQFSTTTKAEFKIATDFVYFSAEEEEARGEKIETKMEEITVTIPSQSIMVEGQEITIPDQMVMVDGQSLMVEGQEITIPDQSVMVDEVITIPSTGGNFANNRFDVAANVTEVKVKVTEHTIMVQGRVIEVPEVDVTIASRQTIEISSITVTTEGQEITVDAQTVMITDGTGTIDEITLEVPNRIVRNKNGEAIGYLGERFVIPERTVTVDENNQYTVTEATVAAINNQSEVTIPAITTPIDVGREAIIPEYVIMVDDKRVTIPERKVMIANQVEADIPLLENFQFSQDVTIPSQTVMVDGQSLMVDSQEITIPEQTVIVDGQEIIIPEQTIDTGLMTETESPVPYGEDNSGLALSSSVEIAFETSFSGSDKLTFKLKGDVLSMENHYLALGNVYDVADNGHTDVEFTGFSYENNLDLGGMMANLIFGTDVNDLDPIVGLDTYYGGGGYDGYDANDFGDAGLGFNVELLSSDAGTVTASASYAVDGAHASDQTGEMGLFGEETDRSFVVGLNWDGALLGGNDALFTVAYQNVMNNMMMEGMDGMMMSNDLTKSIFHLVAGAHFTDSISLSGSYSFGEWNYENMKDMDTAQWLVALNMDDAIFPGNSAGIAYGAPEHVKDMAGMDPTTVLELYYSFKVNDNFTVPVYLDFFSNAGNPMMGNGTDSNAFGFIIRPTLSF